ncbi:MAG: hypothetical protein HWE16_05360 [Gammaproteobacteria bacterium]|nr:hypothetical protein [Gammaproteobacteria bacterium]
MSRTLLILSALFYITACEQNFQPEALKLQQAQAQQVSFFQQDKIPSNLSDWNLFYINNGRLELHSDAIPYHLNTPLFSDYAHKFRSLWLPDNRQIKVSVNGDLEFPVGSVLSKTFYYPRENFNDKLLIAKQIDKAHSRGTSIDLATHHLIETRLLVKQTDGWIALPYIWNQQQTQATLEITGGVQQVKLMGSKNQEFTYIIPDANQCKGCHVSNHTNGLLKPIGPKLKHLDLDYQYSADLSENQLTHLQRLGKIEQLPNDFATNTNWNYRSENINQAARSYLDINCAHCHNPDGPADTSALYLNKENLHKAHLGICKTPVAAGKGTGDRAYDITPGKADESIMLFRMESNDPSIAMPELGRAIVHEEGVTLIKQWIEKLDGNCEVPTG